MSIRKRKVEFAPFRGCEHLATVSGIAVFLAPSAMDFSDSRAINALIINVHDRVHRPQWTSVIVEQSMH